MGGAIGGGVECYLYVRMYGCMAAGRDRGV